MRIYQLPEKRGKTFLQKENSDLQRRRPCLGAHREGHAPCREHSATAVAPRELGNALDAQFPNVIDPGQLD